MIAISAGQRRSGSFAVYQVMREIVTLRKIGSGDWIGAHPEAHMKKWAQSSDYTVLKYHEVPKELAQYVDRVLAVMIIRDPRDVIISLMNRTGQEFEQVFASNAYTRNFTNVDKWFEVMPEGNLLVLRYEEFVINRWYWVMRISEFMGFLLGAGEARKIATDYGLKANRERGDKVDKYDDDYVPARHIASGKVGQWSELGPILPGILEAHPPTARFMRRFGYV
jgi:hypothetical protein